MTSSDNFVQVKSFDLACKVVKFTKQLQSEREFVLSRQLLRCGTSVGANVAEAQSAQSKKDFVAKLYIALKEGRETMYWLNLLLVSDIGDTEMLKALVKKNDEVIRLLVAILKSATAK